jgi:hypothetical protein
MTFHFEIEQEVVSATILAESEATPLARRVEAQGQHRARRRRRSAEFF